MKTRLALLTPLLVTLASCGTAGATSPECASSDPLDRAVCAGQRLREAVEESAEDYHHQQQMDPTSSVNAPLWWAAGIVVVGIFFMLKGPSDARRHAGPGHAGAAKAGLVGGGLRWLGAVLIGVGATLIAWRFGGAGGALLAGIPTGLIGLAGLGRIKADDDAIRGHDLAYQQWQQQVWEAQNNPTYIYPDSPPGIVAEIPPQVVYQQAPPEPQLSHEEAQELYRGTVERDGWNPPEGSALQAVTSIDGKIMPAVKAVSRVSQDLGWGRMISGQGGENLWDSWVRCAAVAGCNGGDARLTLEITHSSIAEETIRKALPSLLRALKVRAGEVDRDISTGTLTLTVTNSSTPVAGSENSDDDDDWVWRG